MLSTRATSDVRPSAAGASRTRNRALRLVLDAALRGAQQVPQHPRFTAEVLDERLVPVFATAGDLTPYAAEVLAEKVGQVGRAARVRLFVGAERVLTLQTLARPQIRWLSEHGLAIHVGA